MQDVVSTPVPLGGRARGRFPSVVSWIRSSSPSLVELGLATLSAALLIFSFPDFDLGLLAWLALVPLLLAIANRPQPWPAFFSGWLFGSIFFYGSCYWLTYSMIHFGGVPAWLAYAMLIPGALVLGLFPAVFAMVLSKLIARFGKHSILLGATVWVALEWARLQCTGQLWNAIGYSQAYFPSIIGIARWGGVYAVSAMIVAVNTAVTLAITTHKKRARLLAAITLVLVVAAGLAPGLTNSESFTAVHRSDALVVAIQPNVPMDLVKSVGELRALTDNHFSITETALRNIQRDDKPLLVIWPESPMNFTYGRDQQLRDRLASFARAHNISLLLNSQEPAPNDGIYNSALLINEQGSLVTQYDKIRLLPFGEYVPLPHWLPGAGLITAIVGDFTPGANYRQMSVGPVRAGVFICIESAYPNIARQYTSDGADVLINISNDGYLGPTAVMRQHLANAVFRAVENDRPVVRVTNTGITAYITAGGWVKDATEAFRPDVRVWQLARSPRAGSFYSSHGDVFVGACGLLTLLAFAYSFKGRRRKN